MSCKISNDSISSVPHPSTQRVFCVPDDFSGSKGAVFLLSLFYFLVSIFLYAFVKRTRTSQKISKISGSTVRIKYKVVLNKAGDRCCPSPTVESSLSGRFEGPRKKDPAAMNSPKHMRQRCRAMR